MLQKPWLFMIVSLPTQISLLVLMAFLQGSLPHFENLQFRRAGF